jgi:hypothetical protein
MDWGFGLSAAGALDCYPCFGVENDFGRGFASAGRGVCAHGARHEVAQADVRAAQRFTVSSIFCGFYAIVLCANPTPTAQQLYGAALAIFFAIFFDGFDGRVARLTRRRATSGWSWTRWRT